MLKWGWREGNHRAACCQCEHSNTLHSVVLTTWKKAWEGKYICPGGCMIVKPLEDGLRCTLSVALRYVALCAFFISESLWEQRWFIELKQEEIKGNGVRIARKKNIPVLVSLRQEGYKREVSTACAWHVWDTEQGSTSRNNKSDRKGEGRERKKVEGRGGRGGEERQPNKERTIKFLVLMWFFTEVNDKF